VILLASILVRVMALIWSLIFLSRVRDWRMGFLSAMLALMALRQILTLGHDLEAEGIGLLANLGSFTEVPGLLVSVLALLAVLFLERMIRQREQLEKAARQRDLELHGVRKMEALGRLAGGIAHDFNNLLTVIVGNIEFAESRLPPDHAALSDLVEARVGAERAERLTRQILTFAREGQSQSRVVNLRQVVDDLLPMLRKLLTENISVEVQEVGGPSWVDADPAQLEQILMNLAVNARDAIEGAGALTICIDASMPEPSLHSGAVGVSRQVQLSVADTGAGMTEDVRSAAFEPFFTTKPAGSGTGLGLSVAYGIVASLGGRIAIESEPGVGTNVQIVLPVCDAPVASLESEEVSTEAISDAKNKVVLLVEDNSAVLHVAERALRMHGYDVRVARNGREGLERAEREAVDLLITDVIMPEIGGFELARRMRERNSDLSVLFISGYAPTSSPGASKMQPGDALLRKPFAPSALIRSVRRVLDRHSASGEGPLNPG